MAKKPLQLLFQIGFLIMINYACTGAPYSYTELQSFQEKTNAKAVAIKDNLASIQKTVALFEKVFGNYQKTQMKRELKNLYANDAVLNDRIHSVSGLEKIQQYFLKTFEKVHYATFLIEDKSHSEKDYYLRWTMVLQLGSDKNKLKFTGMSQLRFDDSGKIILHQDYWDFSELMQEFPIIKSLINTIKNRA